ncbi:tRNA pseudouridine(13) synthase TruD [Candidatus Woesearchaeota archaeon]|nr:tRNA pseudouridine(13) synthase TruD [Candidatus Woesearchaeota archaeon]
MLTIKLKQKPEDFQVIEVIDLNVDKNGKYAYVLLKKRNYNTIDAIKRISEKLKINSKLIGYAGKKDKKAVTTQHISLPRIDKNKIKNLRLKDIKLKFLGYGDKRISLGDLKANKFKIKFIEKLKKTNFLENYFDEQRFGINYNNHILGKLILKRDFKKLDSLIERPDNYYDYKVKLRFFLHSYQSYLFNLVLAEYLSKFDHFEAQYGLGKFIFLKKKIKNFKIPLLSFDTELKGEIGKIYKKILKKEWITLSDFLVKEMPFLVSDTQYRDAFVEVKDLKKKGNYIYFTLSKGSYATVFLKKLSEYNMII